MPKKSTDETSEKDSAVVSQAPIYRKKITMDIFGTKPHVEPGETAWLGDVFGEVLAIEQGQSMYGDFTRLVGEFVAQANSTGELYQSTTAILPGVAQAVLNHYFATHDIDFSNSGRGSKQVRAVFGMEIGIEGRKAKDGGASYSWIIRPRDVKSLSAVAALRDVMWTAPKELTNEAA